MNNKFKKIIFDDLLRSAGLLTFAGAFTAGYNYFFHVAMGRFLSKGDYAVFGALFALSFYLGFILIMTLRVTSAGFISEFTVGEKKQKLTAFYSRFLLWMAGLGLALLVIFTIASPFIADFLHIEKTYLVVLVGLVFFMSWLLPANLGALQGLQRFNHLGLSNVLRAGSKFVLGVGLVMLGFGVLGAVAGLVAGTFVTLIASYYLLNDVLGPGAITKELKKIFGGEKNKDVFDIGAVGKYSVHILLGLACLTIPSNIDVMLVKNMFTTDQAALYTAASVFGRIIFFLPVGIVTALYPKVVKAQAAGRPTRGLLTKSLLFTILPGAVITVALLALPRLFIRILYGPGYLDADGMLRMYALVMFVFSLVAVVTYYYLAKKRYVFVYLLVLASAVQVVLGWLIADSPIELLRIMFGGYIVLLVCFALLMTYFGRNSAKGGIRDG